MVEAQTRRPMGMRAFIVIWIGQIVSILGSAMTGFAVTIWVYQGTEKATALALTGFFFVTPLLLLSPLAGAIVDRYDRKMMMMISDLASGLTTIVVLALHLTGHLQVWHLFVTNAISGAFQTFQWPAYSAAISMMLPKEQYARANGMLELANSGSRIIAPLLAGALLIPLGLTGILLIDIFTFVFAVGTLLFVHIPNPEPTSAGRQGQGNILTESLYGFRYILERPSLLGLQMVFMFGNFFISIPFTVFAAMILARTGKNELVFASVQTAGAIGGLAGGVLMTAWGGPKRLVNGVLGGWIISGLLTSLVGVGQGLPIWAVALFVSSALIPIINGSNQAIWQAKVAPDVQGRVFSIRRLIAWFVNPIATLMAGPLADLLMEPAMKEGGALADAWGWLVGTGSGAGMALLYVLFGGLAALVGLIGFSVPVVRDADEILPDHDALEALPEPPLSPPDIPPWETTPASSGWSTGRKVAVALAATTLVALIIGLGWLQVKVLTGSDSGPVVAEAASVDVEAASETAPTLVTASSPTQRPTERPTRAPTRSAMPVVAQLTPTVVPSTAGPLVAIPNVPVTAGELLIYRLTVANDGPSDATGVVVSDTLPLGVALNFATASQGVGCTVSPGDQASELGAFVVCELGTLKNGASAVVTVSVTLNRLAGGVLTNTVTVAGNEPDLLPINNTIVSVTVINSADNPTTR